MTSTDSIVEQTLMLSTGNHLQYSTTGSDGADAVVLIHGWPDSWRSFEPVLDALPPTVRAVAVSLRGFGGSDAPEHGYEMSDLAADVVELIEHLGITSAVYVGHSMGTLVVQRIAVDRPDLVAGLVLIGGFARLEQALADEVSSVVAELDDPVSEEFTREFQAGTLAAPVPEPFFDQLVAESRRAPAHVWRNAFAGVVNAGNRVALSRIQAPTLLIWGDHDALIPRAEQDHLMSAIPGAQLVVYEGAGHSPNWEQPGRVAADIDAFRQTRGHG